MVVVKEGYKPLSQGFNLILCHSDTPCLRVKPKPIKLQWSEDEIYNHLGVRLSAVPHGGISIHQWLGQQVKVIGLRKNGSTRELEFPGVVADYTAHVDYRKEEDVEEAFPPERSLEIIVGQKSIRETLERFKLKSIDDFADMKLLAVPTNEPLAIDEYTWRLLAAYGNDDKSCIFSAYDAIKRARQPKKTSILWITNKEEVGEASPDGAQGHFFDLVLDEMLKREEEQYGTSLNERDKRAMYHKSCMLVGDVIVAPYGYDADDMDAMNSSKIALGVAIEAEAGTSSHVGYIKKLRKLAKRGAAKGQNICHQVAGSFYNQDKEEVWFYDPDGKGALTSKIGQWAWVGIPCASAHSPNEIICPGDEFWTSKFYKRFFESDLGFK